MSDYEIRPLSIQTWGAFVDLCERHNGGGFGGCWCTWFHRETHSAPGSSTVQRSYDERYAGTRDFKRELVGPAAPTLLWCSTARRRSAGPSTAARLSFPGSLTARTC